MMEGQIEGTVWDRCLGQLLEFRFGQPRSGFYFVFALLRHGFSV